MLPPATGQPSGVIEKVTIRHTAHCSRGHPEKLIRSGSGRLLRGAARGFVVRRANPLFQPRTLDPPLAASADLHRRQRAVANQRVRLRTGNTKHVRDFIKGEEATRHDAHRMAGHRPTAAVVHKPASADYICRDPRGSASSQKRPNHRRYARPFGKRWPACSAAQSASDRLASGRRLRNRRSVMVRAPANPADDC